jgi:hypothetical protein
MSDTEEVIIKRIKPVKDTKPEIAREKLKEKRLRLKAEKEAEIVEKAKQKYADEQLLLQQKLAEEEEKKKNDPMFIMMKKIEELQSQISSKNEVAIPVKKTRAKKVDIEEPVEEPVKPKRTRAKKVEQVVEKPSKPARKPRQIKNAVESPSNIFVGDNTTPNIPQQVVEEQIPRTTDFEFRQPINPLHSILMARRSMY